MMENALKQKHVKFATMTFDTKDKIFEALDFYMNVFQQLMDDADLNNELRAENAALEAELAKAMAERVEAFDPQAFLIAHQKGDFTFITTVPEWLLSHNMIREAE